MNVAYSNKFAVCVIVGGQIMRELPDGSVGLPFGTEYKLRLFNKHDRRAVAKISLDTENVSGGGFVIPPHDQIDIERRADRDTAFRFVELGSDAAINAGKPSTNQSREMGLIEVNFHLERPRPVYQHSPVREIHHHHHYPHSPLRSKSLRRGPGGSSAGGSDVTGGWVTQSGTGDLLGSTKSAEPIHVYNASTFCDQNLASNTIDSVDSSWHDSMKTSASVSKDGCTVDGMSTGIHYTTVHIDVEPDSTLIKLFLQGFKQSVQVNR